MRTASAERYNNDSIYIRNHGGGAMVLDVDEARILVTELQNVIKWAEKVEELRHESQLAYIWEGKP